MTIVGLLASCTCIFDVHGPLGPSMQQCLTMQVMDTTGFRFWRAFSRIGEVWHCCSCWHAGCMCMGLNGLGMSRIAYHTLYLSEKQSNDDCPSCFFLLALRCTYLPMKSSSLVSLMCPICKSGLLLYIVLHIYHLSYLTITSCTLYVLEYDIWIWCNYVTSMSLMKMNVRLIQGVWYGLHGAT